MLMPQTRPRFGIDLADDATQAVQRLEKVLGEDERVQVRLAAGHFQISLARPHRRFWSPCLHIEVIASESGSHLKGMWGPHPDVWTVYSFAAIGLAFLVVVAAMWGLFQSTLNQQPTALFAVPFCLGIAATLYFSAFIGQRLARDQIHLIQETIANALGIDPSQL